MNDHADRDAEYEDHLRKIYRGVPVPLDRIREKLSERSNNRNRSSHLVMEAAVALGIAGVLIAAGLLAPRLINQPSGKGVGVVPPRTAASASPAAQVTCSLPIATIGGVVTQGFFNVSSGTYTPVNGGTNGEAYAAALGRWVPVSAAQVAPDGSAYAYADFAAGQGTLHIVDRQVDRVVVASKGEPIRILGFLSDGVVYLASDPAGSLRTWLLDDKTLHASVVDSGSGRLYQWAGGGAVWGIGPAVQRRGGALYRLDPRTGTETVWFDVDGYLGPEPVASPSMSSEGPVRTPQDDLHGELNIVGFDDGGNPVVTLGSSDHNGLSATVLVTGPHAVQTIIPVGPNDTGHLVPTSATGGPSGIWMVDVTGVVFIYGPSGAVTSLGAIPVPANSTAELAGRCR